MWGDSHRSSQECCSQRSERAPCLRLPEQSETSPSSPEVCSGCFPHVCPQHIFTVTRHSVPSHSSGALTPETRRNVMGREGAGDALSHHDGKWLVIYQALCKPQCQLCLQTSAPSVQKGVKCWLEATKRSVQPWGPYQLTAEDQRGWRCSSAAHIPLQVTSLDLGKEDMWPAALKNPVVNLHRENQMAPSRQ